MRAFGRDTLRAWLVCRQRLAGRNWRLGRRGDGFNLSDRLLEGNRSSAFGLGRQFDRLFRRLAGDQRSLLDDYRKSRCRY